MIFRTLVLAYAAMLCLCAPALADKSSQKHLTGNWGGERTQLAKKGLVFRGHYVGESSGSTAGGLKRAAAQANELMLGFDADLHKLTGKSLGTVHFTFTERSGSSLSKNDIGNILTVQEIYGDGLTPRLTELSYEQPFINGKVDLEAGRIITENDFVASSNYWGGSLYCTFQSNAICGTPIAAPIDSGYVAYPSSAWGVRVKGSPNPRWYLESGVYEVNPTLGLSGSGFRLSTTGDTGIYVPFETGVTLGDASSASFGNVRFGGYYDTSTVSDARHDLSRFVPAKSPALAFLPNQMHAGRYGYWVQADHVLAGSANDGSRGLAAFAALEYGDPQTSLLRSFVDAGIVQHGTFPGRDNDSISFGFALADVNPRLRDFEYSLQRHGVRVPTNGDENIWELNYNARIMPWMSLRPGLQYVVNPSGETSIPNALVIDLSTVINL